MYNSKPKIIPITNAMLATKSQRFGNYIIDMIVHTLLNLIPIVVGWILYEFFGKADLSLWFEQINPIVEFLLNYLVIVIYYMIMETMTGRSFGKYATNTKVFMQDGSEPEPYAVFIRSVSRLIPFEAFSFLGEHAKGWHDTLAKTVVVDLKKYNQELEMADSINEIGKEI